MRSAVPMAVGLGLGVLGVGGAVAGPVTYCVSCTGPDRTYACRVDTTRASPGVDALQYYCIVRTAKEGGHKACSARREGRTACKGAVRTFTYKGPALSPQARDTVRKALGPAQTTTGDTPAGRAETAEPTTLLQMGSRAVKASRKGLQSTGQAVRNAAGRSGEAIGKVTKGAGKRVTGAASRTGQAIGKATKGAGKRVTGAARSAGSAVGSAARKAFGCVRSLFRDCRSKSSDRGSSDRDGRQPAPAPAFR